MSGLGLAGQALAQFTDPGAGNFTFNGYLTFQDSDGNVFTQNFIDWGTFGQDVPIPGFRALEGVSLDDFHLSCSDPLIGNDALVDNQWGAFYFGSYGFVNPTPAPFDNGETVQIIDFFIERQGKGAGVSECGPGLPEVGKTADGSYDLEYQWDITKTVTPASADIFFGDSQAFDYTVSVSADGSTPHNYAVSGSITVRNVLDVPIVVTAVTDVFPGAVGDVSVDCGGALPATLQPAGLDLTPQLTCTYSGASDGTAGTNSASITYTRQDPLGDVGGLTAGATDGFDFSGGPSNVSYASVNVTDVYDQGGALENTRQFGPCTTSDGTSESGDCSDSYTRTLTCADIGAVNNGDSGTKSNTATIDQTGDSDGKTVTLTCHDLTVTKDADPDFTRTYNWTVDKTLDTEEPVRVNEGQTLTLDYTIVAGLDDTTPFVDSDWSVSGTITVTNNGPIAATVNSVADMFTGGSNYDVDCPSGAPTAGPYVILAGESLECSYSGDSDGTTPGTNTATATQQNYARAADGTPTASGTTDYSGTAGFTMDDPDTEVYACVDVYDLFSVGLDEATLMLLQTVLLEQDGAIEGDASLCNEDAPASFSFSYTPDAPWFSDDPPASGEDPPLCELLVDNTADVYDYGEFDPDPLLATDSVRTVIENADCVFGCTLTQGYWKTHSDYGPAPYDENWQKVGDTAADSAWTALGLMDACPDGGQCGEDTPFFSSGESWYSIMWIPPKGNAYFNLAHQFVATTLNVLNEADPSAIADDWADAKAIFEACGPESFEKTKGKKGGGGPDCGYSARDVKQLAGILDAYNNGLIGPGHCSEDDTSAE